MTIASIKTMLPLDRYANIMRISPVHFSGCGGVELSNGNILYPTQNVQETIWSQNDWNNPNQVGRNTIAGLISRAETEIVDFLGYFPTPNWTENEQHNFTSVRNHSLGIYSISFQLDKLKFIVGGRRKSISVIDDVDVTMEDLNSDGFYETRRVTIAKPTYPLEQLKVYFSGYDGDPLYEIRPPKSKKVVGNNVVFEFNAWQLIDPDVLEDEQGNDPNGIDLNDEVVMVDTVDIYREYNDVSQNGIVIFSGDDPEPTEIGGYIMPLDNQSYVRGIPGSYNQSTSSWEKTAICEEVLYASFWYYSGEKIPSNQYVQNNDDFMSEYIAKAIAFLATSRLERDFMGTNNVLSLVQDLRIDYTTPDRDTNFNVPFDISDCPFGTRKGEYQAWKMIKNFQQRRFNSATI